MLSPSSGGRVSTTIIAGANLHRATRELLRLPWPRWLAARSDFPLEYPENASERVPLRSLAVRALSPL